MKSFKRLFFVFSMSAILVGTSEGVAGAVSMPVIQAPGSSDIITVQDRRPPPPGRPGMRPPSPGRPGMRPPPRPRPGYHHGYRGYRDRRPGYRYYNGWWFPLAAFGAGAIIGGAVATPARPAGLNPRHYEWCAARYKTYRASDNTYVPRVGERATCVSPYY